MKLLQGAQKFKLGVFMMKTSFFLVMLASLSIDASQAQGVFRTKGAELIGEISQSMPAVVLEAKVPVYKVVNQWVPRQVTCNRVDCSTSSGDGSKGNWNNFFSAPRAEKPKALADSIKGVGVPTAERIIAAGFFKSKPRSWGEFSQEIVKSESALIRQGYQGRFSELVLEKFGEENSKSLGYYLENSCQIVTYPCTVFEEIETEIFVYNIERKVEVKVENQVLQSFEKDSYKIKVGMDPREIEVTTAGGYNNYSFVVNAASAGFISITLKGQGRKGVPFPLSASSVSLANDSNGLKIVGQVESQYLPSGDDAASTLVMVYKICRINWFGGCFSTVIINNQVITGAAFEIKIPGSALRNNTKYKVWYTLKRVGSKYYSLNGVENTTNVVKYK
jgi:hypothetical protein